MAGRTERRHLGRGALGRGRGRRRRPASRRRRQSGRYQGCLRARDGSHHADGRPQASRTRRPRGDRDRRQGQAKPASRADGSGPQHPGRGGADREPRARCERGEAGRARPVGVANISARSGVRPGDDGGVGDDADPGSVWMSGADVPPASQRFLRIESTTFLASPNSIMVLSRKNTSFSTPAYPEPMPRLMKSTVLARSTSRIGMP